MPAALDRVRIDAVVQAVADRLAGDWLLVGGGLVALWLTPRRMTEDVDLVGMEGSGADRLSLLGLAIDVGLPVETLNSAADFFVHRISDWRGQVELFRQGASGRIFRPSATLFLLLKVHRLSEQDLSDCLDLLARVVADQLFIDVARVESSLAALPTAQGSVLERRILLQDALRALPQT